MPHDGLKTVGIILGFHQREPERGEPPSGWHVTRTARWHVVWWQGEGRRVVHRHAELIKFRAVTLFVFSALAGSFCLWVACPQKCRPKSESFRSRSQIIDARNEGNGSGTGGGNLWPPRAIVPLQSKQLVWRIVIYGLPAISVRVCVWITQICSVFIGLYLGMLNRLH